jgi:1-aminocyclopropane-1-carboxylate deaminase
VQHLLSPSPFVSLKKTFNNFNVDALRLDTLHPIISGNKIYKLYFYIEKAILENKGILTFGGAFSNHIVATAYACNQFNIKCRAIIRGQKMLPLSHTLLSAEAYGMELIFVSRTDYKNKELLAQQQLLPNEIIVPEGGLGIEGIEGAKKIVAINDVSNYSHIVTAVGTGTTIAGIALSAKQYQKIIGINVLKGYDNILQNVYAIAPKLLEINNLEIINNFSFGGYAKANSELFTWMNLLWKTENLPTDFVYTAKTFFAIKSLIDTNYFSASDSICVLHTGGLQGNLSLKNNVLCF